jgi:hypothetical protein
MLSTSFLPLANAVYDPATSPPTFTFPYVGILLFLLLVVGMGILTYFVISWQRPQRSPAETRAAVEWALLSRPQILGSFFAGKQELVFVPRTLAIPTPLSLSGLHPWLTAHFYGVPSALYVGIRC